MILDAKCPECGERADLDDEATEVNCRHCGFHALYDEYLEMMRERAINMANDFQEGSDKRPF